MEANQEIPTNPITAFLGKLGALRVALALLALFTIVMAPAAGTTPIYSGWGVVSTVIVVALAPMILMLLLLDALMGRVFMVDATGAERQRFGLVVKTNLVLAAVLVGFWAPYFMALMP